VQFIEKLNATNNISNWQLLVAYSTPIHMPHLFAYSTNCLHVNSLYSPRETV